MGCTLLPLQPIAGRCLRCFAAKPVPPRSGAWLLHRPRWPTQQSPRRRDLGSTEHPRQCHRCSHAEEIIRISTTRARRNLAPRSDLKTRPRCSGTARSLRPLVSGRQPAVAGRRGWAFGETPSKIWRHHPWLSHALAQEAAQAHRKSGMRVISASRSSRPMVKRSTSVSAKALCPCN